jgi:hypothetical protein
VDKVVFHVERDGEFVDVTIHWQGGFTSRHEAVRPVRSYEQLRDLDELMDRIAALRDEGRTTALIADALNRDEHAPSVSEVSRASDVLVPLREIRILRMIEAH